MSERGDPKPGPKIIELNPLTRLQIGLKFEFTNKEIVQLADLTEEAQYWVDFRPEGWRLGYIEAHNKVSRLIYQAMKRAHERPTS